MAEAEALFAAHHAGLLRYLSKVTGRAEDARDLTQDVFVRALRAGRLPEQHNERRAWLFRIARNLAIDHHRRAVHRTTTTLTNEPADAPPASGGSVERQLGLRRALASLDATDRDVFLLREVSGLSYVEISSVCDLTEAAVRNRIHRARLALRTHLAASIADLRLR